MTERTPGVGVDGRRAARTVRALGWAMRLVLGLAMVVLSGCAAAPAGPVRGPAAGAPMAWTPPEPQAVGLARFQPDDPACGATACAGRVLVSQVWDLVRR